MSDAQRILAEAYADCGCGIPSPFDEVAEHAVTIAEAKGFERGKALSTPTTPDEGLSAFDERDLAEMVTAWRSSLANPASWMEKLRALLAPSEGANYSATAAVDPKPFATGEMDVEQIAKGLTKARQTALLNLGAEKGECERNGGWRLAPHDGWRRSGQACSGLCDIGLAEKRGAGTIYQDAPAYRLTPLGLAVRVHLLASRGRA